jgi:hypothetical protein
MTTVQPTKLPTNKALTMAGGTVVLTPLIQPAVFEVWPQIAPMFLAGDAMTALVGGLLTAIASLAFAYFVPDRSNIKRS